MKRKYYEKQQLNGNIVHTIWHDSGNYMLLYEDGSFEVIKKKGLNCPLSYIFNNARISSSESPIPAFTIFVSASARLLSASD